LDAFQIAAAQVVCEDTNHGTGRSARFLLLVALVIQMIFLLLCKFILPQNQEEHEEVSACHFFSNSVSHSN